MNEIEKFERHIGKGKEIKLKNEDDTEDVFYFKPLNVDFLPNLMKLAKATEPTKIEKEEINRLKQDIATRKITQEQYDSHMKVIEEASGMRIMEGENSKILLDLLKGMMDLSYPGLDKEKRDSFIYYNLKPLTKLLIDLNEGISDVSPETLSQIELLKKRTQSYESTK